MLNKIKQEIEKEFEEKFWDKFDEEKMNEVMWLNARGYVLRTCQHFLSQAIDKSVKEVLEGVEEKTFEILNNSSLTALISSMERQVGHTYSAINGVKNSNNAVLVVAHNNQKQSIDLTREKMVTIDDIKFGKLRGMKKAMVCDNYVLFKINGELFNKFKQALQDIKEEK